MSTLRILVHWRCERCDVVIAGLHEYGDSLWAPDGINWVKDESGEHLLCEQHTDEWHKELEEREPGLVWRA